jgi:MoaA/NifB/PqqE/SkfB family radical SAM enzyme
MLRGIRKKHGIVVISPGCSNKCVFCLNTYSDPYSPSELKEQEIKISRDLLDYQKRGYTDLNITGNDPLEYGKLVPMVRYFRSLGFTNIMLCTHGKISSSANTIQELVDVGITSFRIPIYGSNAKIHEAVTQSKGSFEMTLNGIKNIKKLGEEVMLHLLTTIVQQNKEDILNILQLALKFKPNYFSFDTPYLYPGVTDNSFYVPYKDLKPHIKKVTDYISKSNTGNILFNDIPYCVFESDNRMVIMSPHFIKLKKWKTKFKMCKNCKLSYKCDGFYLNDVKKYGIGDLNPITR